LRHEQTGALEAIERILNRGGDADDVLREVLAVLGRLYPYVAVEFVEEDGTLLGPELGTLRGEAVEFPVVYQARRIGALLAAGAQDDDRPFLERVATIVSPYVLVGWDTGGIPWPGD
jgi:hypothetical protein